MAADKVKTSRKLGVTGQVSSPTAKEVVSKARLSRSHTRTEAKVFRQWDVCWPSLVAAIEPCHPERHTVPAQSGHTVDKVHLAIGQKGLERKLLLDSLERERRRAQILAKVQLLPYSKPPGL